MAAGARDQREPEYRRSVSSEVRRRGPGPTAIVALIGIGALIAAGGPMIASASPGRDRVGAAPVLAGHGWVALVYELSLSTRVVGAPWGLALDGAIGVGPRLTIGVSESAAALGTIDRSGGRCLTSVAHDCPRSYRGGLLDVRWRLRDGPWAAAALARLGVSGVAPLRPLVRLGLRGAGQRGRWWGVAEPEIAISLGERAAGNRDTIELPIWLGVDGDVGPGLISAWLRTGVRGEIDELDEKYELALGAGAAIGRDWWRAGLDLGWPQLLGPQNSFKQRQASVWLALEI